VSGLTLSLTQNCLFLLFFSCLRKNFRCCTRGHSSSSSGSTVPSENSELELLGCQRLHPQSSLSIVCCMVRCLLLVACCLCFVALASIAQVRCFELGCVQQQTVAISSEKLDTIANPSLLLFRQWTFVCIVDVNEIGIGAAVYV